MLPTSVIQFINTNRDKISDSDLGQLTRHLEMVREVSLGLAVKLEDAFTTSLDKDQIGLGASLHDIGKLFYPEEIHGEGNRHEGTDVRDRLIAAGFPYHVASYCMLHTLRLRIASHLIVETADVLWRGGRDMDLEMLLPEALGGDTFEDSGFVDEICEDLARDGLKRLQYQKEGLLR